MSTPPLDSFEAGRLEANARLYKPDAQLDRLADLYSQNRAEWDKLPARLKDLSILHLDMRNRYDRAAEMRIVPDRSTFPAA